MQRWMISLTALCLLVPAACAQEEEPDGDPTGLDNVRLVIHPEGHAGRVADLAFSPDGRRLFTLGLDRTVQVWNTETAQRERVIRPPFDLKTPTGMAASQGLSFAVSPDGSTLAVSGGNWERGGKTEHPVLLVNLADGKYRTLLGVKRYYAASPGGERMMGFAVEEQSDRVPVFHPAARFRKQLYRPELISLVLEKGTVKAALAATKTRAEVPLADILPPRVTELKVEAGKPGEVTVRVTAEAASPKQPVEALELRLDGRPVPGLVREFKEPVAKAAAAWTKVMLSFIWMYGVRWLDTALDYLDAFSH